MTEIRIQEFSPAEAPGMAEEWNSLLRASEADPLFMGWEWLTTWWESFGRTSEAEWVGLRAVDDTQRTLAICPLFRRTSRLRGFLPVTRLEVLGTFWYGPSSVLTQYGQFLGDFESHPGLMGALLDHLAERLDWSELVFPMLPKMSRSLPALETEARRRGWRVRTVPTPPSQVVRFDEGFQAYLRTLGAKTRRRLFNQRKRLSEIGRVGFRHVDLDEAQRSIQVMNNLRNQRGVRGSFSGRAVDFHRMLFGRLEPRGRLRLSVLSVDESPVSVNYALRVGEKEYGVQMGFDASLERRLSLGMLHLGYALEAAASDGIRTYDLMTSTGGGPEWKKAISNTQVEMVALQIVRNEPLYWLYRLYDFQGKRS